MSTTREHQLEERIEQIKAKLQALGPIRPGSISRQYRLPKEKRRPFYQISYTHRMRSHSEYLRPEHLAAVRQETLQFRQFRRLVDQWVDLALKLSQHRMRSPAGR